MAPAAINTPSAMNTLRPVCGVLLARAALYGQLLGIEWAEQKIRLSKMLAITLLGFSCLLCVLLFSGVLVMALNWESAYKVQIGSALIAVYGLGVVVACYRFSALAASSTQAFMATRAEFAADIALLKSKL